MKRWGPDGKGYVATRPTCGPLLFLSPTLKHRNPPNGKGYVATLLTCGPMMILSPHSEALGTP